MANKTYPQRLAWIDIETDGLPDGNDFSVVNLLEFAMIVTDFDLQPEAGYEEVIKLTKAGADRIKSNEYVKKMHGPNGLIKEAVASEFTLEQVEQNAIATLKEMGLERGEFMIAGSGVAMFDFPLIKEKMPELAKWFAYFVVDVGVLRRTIHVFAGKDLVAPVRESFEDGVKAHRARGDVEAHMKEASRFSEYFRSLS